MHSVAKLAPRFLPFLKWIGELKDQKVLRADVLAGLTVALVLIPQSMAYAQLAGLPAYYGLYAAFLPPIVSALFGSSRQLATGPVAVVSLLTAAALQPIAASGTGGYIAYAITLALMVGVFQLALGAFRLGVIVNFLSHPVVIGFTNAAAIIIATSQLDKIFGVQIQQAAHHYETVWRTATAVGHYIHWPTFIIAVLAFAIMIALRRINPRLPNILIAVAVTILVSWMIGFEKKQTISMERIASETVREIVTAQLTARREVDVLAGKVEAAELAHKKAANRHGNSAPRTLAALHNLDNLKQRRDRRIVAAAQDLQELKGARFDFVPGSEPGTGTFYLGQETPAEAATDGNTWRIDRLEEDGVLVMDGGGKVVGDIPRGLPSFMMPTFDLGIIFQLLSAAVTIALMGFMEAVSMAKAMAAKTRQRFDPNQELLGQGLGNVVGSLFQSYAVSGSFSRSAVNLSAGAITGFSSVVTGVLVVFVLLWFTPLLYHLPQATLAAVIMMAVVGLINVKSIAHAWHAHIHDGVVAITTFILTLAFAPHLDKGILIGAALALVLYLYRSMKPRVAVLARHEDGTLRDAEANRLELCNNIAVVRFDGSLFFANTAYFEDKVLERVALKPELAYVIVIGDGINEIDATGEDMLSGLVKRLGDNGIEVLFTGLKKQVLDILERTDFIDHLGKERFFRTEEQALEYAWKKLGNNHEVDCPLNTVCRLDGGYPDATSLRKANV